MKKLIPLLLLLINCTFLQLPENYSYVEGENIIIFKNDATIPSKRYDEVLVIAERAYKTAKEMLQTEQDIKIFITISSDDETSGRSAAAGSNFIFIHSLYFTSFDIALENTLSHEITHNLIYHLYGSTNSFLFTEGVADWVKYRGNPHIDPSLLYMIYDLFSVTEQENIANSPLFEKYTHEAYVLAASFTGYLIENYSMETFFQIYSEISTSNFASVLEQKTGDTFETLLDNYIKQEENRETYYFNTQPCVNELQHQCNWKRRAVSNRDLHSLRNTTKRNSPLR